MDKFVSKLSLYDILSMIIPGGTILLFLSLSLGMENFCIKTNKMPSWLFITIISVASYLVGLINHVVTSYFFGWFSRHAFFIKEYIKHKTKNPCKVLTTIKNICRYIISHMALLICLVYLICAIFFHFLSNKEWSLLCPTVFFLIFFLLGFCNINKNVVEGYDADSNDKQDVFHKYYYVLKNRYSDDIPIIEGQIAFIQNMIFPLSLFFFIPLKTLENYFGGEHLLSVYLIYLLFYVLLVPTMYCRQLKINQRLREDFEYLNQI